MGTVMVRNNYRIRHLVGEVDGYNMWKIVIEIIYSKNIVFSGNEQVGVTELIERILE